jgi:hypothetical protein
MGLRATIIASLLLPGAAYANVDGAVSAAIDALASVPPEFRLSSQTLRQVDGCTVAVQVTLASPPESRARQEEIYANLAEVDFANARIAEAPTEAGEGAVILLPNVLNRSFREVLRTGGTDPSFQDYILENGGQCDGDTCVLEHGNQFFRIHAMTSDAQTDAQILLTALTEAGAACGAPGT